MELPRRLSYLMPLVQGESTGSYVTRLAARHRQTVSYLLATVGEGQSAGEVDPRYTELYLNRAARQRLSALAGRPLEQLMRALVSLREEHLLPDGHGAPAWKWPWRSRGGHLVRGCALCAARRGITDPVWLIRPDPWHICVRHGRFSDDSRSDRVPFIDLSPGPHVVAAERRRLRLVRQLGPLGRVLVADAFGVLAHEAVLLPYLGSGRTAPLHLLPVAVRIASLMAPVERRRLEYRLTSDDQRRWYEQVKEEMGWRLGRAVAAWSEQHPLLEGPHADRPRQGQHPRLAVPHTQVPAMASVGELACVPWRMHVQETRPYG